MGDITHHVYTHGQRTVNQQSVYAPDNSRMHPSFSRLFEAAIEVTRDRKSPIRTYTDLATALGEAPQTISNWKVRGVSESGAIKAQAILGIGVTFVRDGAGQKLVAQSVSQDSLKLARQDDVSRVEWGSMTYDELPQFFEVIAPDNAMADRVNVKKGMIILIRKQRTAEADQGVLVANAAGDWFFRQYIKLGGERFRAAPTNKDYGPPLDSEADGLEILGVRLSHTDAGAW